MTNQLQDAPPVMLIPQPLLSGSTRTALVLLGWQLLSAALACTSILSQLLADHHFNAPLIQSFGNYFLLALIFVPSRCQSPPRLSWYYYLMIAIADVYGNYFVVLAYQYTDIASATLLDCFSIPCVVLLSIMVLKTKYNSRQAAGIVVCVIGLAALVACDIASNRASTSAGSHKLLGDCLVLLGCSFYSISNVAQEHVVKEFDPVEFLANIGLWGALVSATQIAIFERAPLHHLFTASTGLVRLYLGLFVVALSSIYIGVPWLLRFSSATVMNLSFLTSDFWGVLAALFLFRENLQWYYFCAVALVIGGVVIYHLAHHSSPDLHALPVQANPKSSTEEEQQILVEPEPSLFNAPLPTAMCAVDSLGSSLVDKSLKSDQ